MGELQIFLCQVAIYCSKDIFLKSLHQKQNLHVKWSYFSCIFRSANNRTASQTAPLWQAERVHRRRHENLRELSFLQPAKLTNHKNSRSIGELFRSKARSHPEASRALSLYSLSFNYSSPSSHPSRVKTELLYCGQ